VQTSRVAEIPTTSIGPNPHNPRLFFNEESLDLLRTSIQEVGILVPLIVYPDPSEPGQYVLLDGERRHRSAIDLGLEIVPVNITPEPSEIDNVLRMFNIHAVREDWPLVSVALSLQRVMEVSKETRESRLAEMTGLTRSAVRRAKRLLGLPGNEIELIRREAHLPRNDQVHREDLYLEIDAATSVLLSAFPEIATEFSREQIIRQFAMKREINSLKSVTEFRNISKIVSAARTELVPRPQILGAIRRLIDDPGLNPSTVFEGLLHVPYQQQTINRKASSLIVDLEELPSEGSLSEDLRSSLSELRTAIDALLSR
jgi:ParB family transcriptional regulator, chromosome partitioning protein